MGHYKANVRDLEFNLFEVFGRQDILGQGLYEDLDVESAKDILGQVARLAENELADSLIDSDRNPPIYDPQSTSVVIPQSFKKSYQAYLDAEWWRMDVPVELGGMLVPPSLRWCVAELVCGSNPAVHMYGATFSFARLLWHLGTPDQKKLAEWIIKGKWHTTMVLTEPDAGSDVGAGRTKAVQQPDGTWHISGVKRFITSGESDMCDNIVHFVLARPEGAGVGTKGLSLFIVPKYHVDVDTGELGERNGVYATNVEKKMGLKVSTTCELTFGDKHPAVGTLLGDVHDGIAQMFHIIEGARMFVGTKAIATLSTGYLNALDYAKQRVQGADLTTPAKDAPRVTITHHPDVRRSLMLQKAYAEGLRALVIFTATYQDTVDIETGADPAVKLEKGSAADTASRMSDLLLPIVKGLGSERAWVLLGTESLQTFGGSGFLQEYPLEQYVRDAKIDTLYEGTTAIQGLDFFFRKIIRDKGRSLTALSMEMTKFAKNVGAQDGALDKERAALGKAIENMQGIMAYLAGTAMKSDPRMGGDLQNLYKVGQNTSRLLLSAGDLVVGWLLLRQAEVAQEALNNGATGKDADFYTGKVAAAKFFTHQVLPRLATERAIAEATDNSLMEVPEAAF